ncbi:MAG: sulfatase [Actinomycetia bacterium]|nr:sulfatase [Actinomycetes bacterium]
MRGGSARVRAAFLVFVVIALVGAVPLRGRLAVPAAATPTRPNIVLIMSDDQRVGDQWVMSKTNALLAATGTTFSNFFVSNPQCCPARASFLTGQYSHNNGVWSNDQANGGFSHFADANTLPVWMHAAGYHTALIGKYLNGYGTKNQTYVPPGWDDWHALVGDSAYKMYGYTMSNNGVPQTAGTAPQDYQTDALGELAASSIHTQAQSSNPFFLELTPTAPHDGPNVRSPERYKTAFRNNTMPTGPGYNEADVSDKPAFIRGQPSLTATNFKNIQTAWRDRLRMLMALDDMVQRVHDQLQADGLLDNTVVIYTGDNGYFLGEHRLPDGKHQPYEEAIREPLIISGPGWPAGASADAITSNVDIAQTVTNMAGATPGLAQDGVSLQSVVADPVAFTGRALLLEAGDSNDPAVPFEGVRTPGWKYVEYITGEQELYDLTNDPNELQSVHDQPATAGVQSQLATLLHQLETCAGANCRRFVDASSPETTINGAPPVNSSSNTATFTFSSSDSASTFTCSLDSATFTGCSSPTSYTLVDGDHTFAVQATNLAGTSDPTPATYSWNIKTNAPDTFIDDGPPTPSSSAAAHFAFSASEANVTIQCALDTTTFSACPSPANYSGLTDGNHSLRVRARDSAGNVDPSPASWSWLVDTTPPVVTFNTPAAGATYRQYTPTNASYSCDDALTIVMSCNGNVADGAPLDTAHPGTHSISVYTADGAGNSTTVARTYTVTAITGPVVSIGDATIDEGDAGNRAIKFTVSLLHPATGTVNVQYTTVNGSAKSPSDYKATSGTVTFSAGQISKPVMVNVAGDTVAESDETFSVSLTSADATVLDGTGIGTIRDDSTSGVVLSVGDASVWEGDSGNVQVTVQVNLSRPPGAPVNGTWSTVALSATSPSDYKIVTAKPFTIPANATSVSFIVALKGDVLAEGTESFRIDVAGVTGATVGGASGFVSILDEPSDG